MICIWNWKVIIIKSNKNPTLYPHVGSGTLFFSKRYKFGLDTVLSFFIYFEDESANKNKEKEGLETEHIETLERLKANQRQDYLQGTVTGSVQASDRLMKELRDIYRSDSFKMGRRTIFGFIFHSILSTMTRPLIFTYFFVHRNIHT